MQVPDVLPAFLSPMATWTSAALSGMAEPWVIVAALALTTLLLEDVAIAAGVAVATQGALSWEWAFVAVAGGIALGDVGLYGLGVGANRIPFLRRKYIDGRESKARDLLAARLPSAVLIARVVPGLRLITYTACGFWRAPLWPFTAWVFLAVALWTAGLFWLSSALGDVIADALGVPAPLAVALPVIALALAFPLWRWLRRSASLN
jgi:membrane protein DedA with SNARE-associated domain